VTLARVDLGQPSQAKKFAPMWLAMLGRILPVHRRANTKQVPPRNV